MSTRRTFMQQFAALFAAPVALKALPADAITYKPIAAIAPPRPLAIEITADASSAIADLEEVSAVCRAVRLTGMSRLGDFARLGDDPRFLLEVETAGIEYDANAIVSAIEQRFNCKLLQWYTTGWEHFFHAGDVGKTRMIFSVGEVTFESAPL